MSESILADSQLNLSALYLISKTEIVPEAEFEIPELKVELEYRKLTKKIVLPIRV